MPPTDRLKLINGWTGHKESLGKRDPVRLFVPTEARASATSLVDLRTFCVAELLQRVLEREGRTIQTVANPAQADLVVGRLDSKSTGRAWLVTVAEPEGEYLPDTSTGEARYLMLTMPHASPVQWSAPTVAGAKAALGRLKDYLSRLGTARPPNPQDEGLASWRARFYDQLCDDLNTPRALTILWTMLQSELSAGAKYRLLGEFCTVFGLEETLGLPKRVHRPNPAPARPETSRDWNTKKPLKTRTGVEGESGKQLPAGAKGAKPVETAVPEGRRRIIQSREVRSHLNEPDRFDFTVSLIAFNNLPELRTTLESLLYYLPRSARSVEVVVVEMNGQPEIGDYLEMRAAQIANFRVVYAQQNLGEGAGRNVAFRQSRGRYLLLLDAGVKLTGDIFEKLWANLESQTTPALYGPFGLKIIREDNSPVSTEPLLLPAEKEPVEVEGLDGSVLVVPRRLIDEVGFMDEHFRFPYALDLDYSFGFRDKGFLVKALPDLASVVERPATGRPTYGLTSEQQDRQRQKNWLLFLRSWQLE